MEDNKTTSNSPKASHKKKLFEHWHMIAFFLILYDLATVTGSYFLALWLRFDCQFSEIPYEYLISWFKFAPIYAVISVIVFWRFHLYQSIWRFASFIELERISMASVLLGVIHSVGITVVFMRMPITYYIVGVTIQFLMTLCVRFG